MSTTMIYPIPGYLDGGMQALESRPDLVQRLERITASMLAERLAETDPPMILDVRTEREWQNKHIEGSVNMALQHLPERLSEIPSERPVVIHCATGYRSSIAASLLEKHGRTRVADLVGGFAAWEASQLETVGSAGTEVPVHLLLSRRLLPQGGGARLATGPRSRMT